MRRVFFSIIIIIVCVVLYGMYFNINGLNTYEYTIKSDKIAESFKELKFIHFTDLLYGSTTNQSTLDNLVKEINEKEADVVFFTGDLFYKDHKPSEKELVSISASLSKINASLYKFAVIGENDNVYIDEYKSVLEKSNFILLDNQNFLLFYKDITPINIIGINNLSNIDELLKTEFEYNYSILLTHKPDLFSEIQAKNVDLVLSGHSLNGQVRIPYYGGIIKSDGAKNYLDSHYVENITEMYVSNGLGTRKYKIRLFNKPSFNVYRITKR